MQKHLLSSTAPLGSYGLHTSWVRCRSYVMAGTMQLFMDTGGFAVVKSQYSEEEGLCKTLLAYAERHEEKRGGEVAWKT